MKTQHTPTPWQIDDNENLEIRALDSLTICRFDMSDYNEKCTEANAAHIVKCVNGWDDFESLVLRLRELVSQEHTSVNFENALIDEANRIKRAKGGGNGNG